MKEFHIGISTNKWNAARYTLFTLAIIPLAEKLLQRWHGKRTGFRVMQGNEARLRQSTLAHWGLHQEVDEKSVVSKASAVAICILHIAGTLLLEFGSGSEKAYSLRRQIVSPTLRDEGHLLANGVYFFDAGYTLGALPSESECIDASAKTLSQFSLSIKRAPFLRLLHKRSIPDPLEKDLIAKYFVPNSGSFFEVFGNRKYFWYARREHSFGSHLVRAFINETTGCWRNGWGSYNCQKKGKLNHVDLLSESVAFSAFRRPWDLDMYLRKEKKILSAILSRVRLSPYSQPCIKADIVAETAWLRGHMNRKELPRKSYPFKICSLHLKLKFNGLKEGCKHDHAKPISHLSYLTDLKASKPIFPRERLNISGVMKHSQDLRILVFSFRDKIMLGTLSQKRNEYCSSLLDSRLCLIRLSNRKFQVNYYSSHNRSPFTINKVYTFTVHGLLHLKDIFDFLIQVHAEARRSDPITEKLIFQTSQIRVSKLIESGKMASGLVRRIGVGVSGTTVAYEFTTATINMLGIAGAVILIFLVTSPIPFLCVYWRGLDATVETSYKRSVMGIHGEEICAGIPDSTPSIFVTKALDGAALNIKHTYKM